MGITLEAGNCFLKVYICFLKLVGNNSLVIKLELIELRKVHKVKHQSDKKVVIHNAGRHGAMTEQSPCPLVPDNEGQDPDSPPILIPRIPPRVNKCHTQLVGGHYFSIKWKWLVSFFLVFGGQKMHFLSSSRIH